MLQALQRRSVFSGIGQSRQYGIEQRNGWKDMNQSKKKPVKRSVV